MFWDGSRWIDERSIAPASTSSSHKTRDRIATIPILLLLPALLFPFLTTTAAPAPAISTAGAAVDGHVLTVSGSGFQPGFWVRLQWDGSSSGMPTVRVASNGLLAATIKVPKQAALGNHVLAAVGAAWAWNLTRGGAMTIAAPSHTVLASTTVIVMAQLPSAGGPAPKGAGPTAPPAAPTSPPTAAPTAAPTVAPTAAPTAAPVVTPAPPTPAPTARPTPVAGTCPASLQAAINGTSTGGTLNVTGCTFHESVTVGKAMTLIGGTITGDNSRTSGLTITGTGTIVDGMTVTAIKNANQTPGAIEIRGDNDVVKNSRALNSTGPCLSVDDARGVTVAGTELAGCGQEGYHVSGAVGLTLTGLNVHDNGGANTFVGGECGGGKISGSDQVTVSNGEFDHNACGAGIWLDVFDKSVLISGNRVHDNDSQGILVELADGPVRVTGNDVWNNGFGFTTWAWGSGIVSSTSANVEIDHNLVAWNADGINFIWQNRGGPAATGLTSLDNIVAMAPKASDTSDTIAASFMGDPGSVIISSGNTGAGDQFWWPGGPNVWCAYQWAGCLTFAQWQASPGGAGDSLISTAALAQKLSAADMPVAP